MSCPISQNLDAPTKALDSLLIGVAFPPVPSGVGMTGLLQIPVMRRRGKDLQKLFLTQ